MSHLSVRTLIEDIATDLDTVVDFGYGRATDFNQIKDKQDPYIWLDPLPSTVQVNEDNLMVSEVYSVALTFYKFDAPDSTEEQYKLILDECDSLVNKFIHKMNESLDNIADNNLLHTANTVMGAINKQPFIKVTADCLTGFTLNFDLTVPDLFDYCA